MTPYTEAERANVAAELVELLRGDEDVAGAELIGSLATGTADAFSDVDVAVRVDAVARVADRWTARVHEWLPVVANFAVEFPPDHVRGFLLKGIDDLPAEELEPLEATLAASLEPAELRRALEAALRAFLDEVRRRDEQTAERLEPALVAFLRFAESQPG